MDIRDKAGIYVSSKYNASLANEIINWLISEGYESNGRKEWIEYVKNPDENGSSEYVSSGELTSREEYYLDGYTVHVGWQNVRNGMNKIPVIEIFDDNRNYYSLDYIFGY